MTPFIFPHPFYFSNTSLNGNGEPLVETPQDAINFFNRSPVDILVLEDRMLTRDLSTSPEPALSQVQN